MNRGRHRPLRRSAKSIRLYLSNLRKGEAAELAGASIVAAVTIVEDVAIEAAEAFVDQDIGEEVIAEAVIGAEALIIMVCRS